MHVRCMLVLHAYIIPMQVHKLNTTLKINVGKYEKSLPWEQGYKRNMPTLLISCKIMQKCIHMHMDTGHTSQNDLHNIVYWEWLSNQSVTCHYNNNNYRDVYVTLLTVARIIILATMHA